jgi:hypothetical protein
LKSSVEFDAGNPGKDYSRARSGKKKLEAEKFCSEYAGRLNSAAHPHFKISDDVHNSVNANRQEEGAESLFSNFLSLEGRGLR